LHALAEKYFSFPKGEVKKTKARPVPAFRKSHKTIEIGGEQAHFLIGFEGVGFRDPFRFDALILSFFLGGGMSSRLFQEVRERAGLAYSVECDCVPFTDTGVFTIYAALSPRSIGQCLDIIGKEIARLKTEPLTENDLGVVKGQLKGTILMASDQMETRQESLGRNELVFGRYVSVDEVVAEIDRVSPERVHELANRLFVPEKEAIVAMSRAVPRRALTIF
jgi:predicted Zn-dependent peptidase